MSEPHWINPADIRFKISPHADLGAVVGGGWDQDRRHALDGLVKHRAIRQRFIDGARWEDTELFASIYRRRLKRGPVRGATTLADLAAQYYDRVDGLHDDMKRNGFALSRNGRIYPLPVLLIGRREVFIGNQGNHRLAIAQILKLERFAGRVICKHPLA